jgi:hypothetical protein
MVISARTCPHFHTSRNSHGTDPALLRLLSRLSLPRLHSRTTIIPATTTTRISTINRLLCITMRPSKVVSYQHRLRTQVLLASISMLTTHRSGRRLCIIAHKIVDCNLRSE